MTPTFAIFSDFALTRLSMCCFCCFVHEEWYHGVLFAGYLSGGQLFGREALCVGDRRWLRRTRSTRSFWRILIWILWPGGKKRKNKWCLLVNYVTLIQGKRTSRLLSSSHLWSWRSSWTRSSRRQSGLTFCQRLLHEQPAFSSLALSSP